MQQQGGGGGGGGAAQQFGVQTPPEMPSFSQAGEAGQRISLAEAPSPISSRPPAQQFDELVAGGGAGGFDSEALAAGAVGEEGASGGTAGSRWPRQETLALLKIRSDMDAAFRDATLKGPLWEEVSRKLAQEGYRRSAKKCKEKFENMHKYYKRTKESRAGRSDGKTYRFFTQLEALHGTGAAATAAAAAAPVASLPPPATMTVGVSGVAGPSAVRAPAEPPPVGATAMVGAATAGMPLVGDMSLSTSNTEEDSDEDSDDEGTEEMGGSDEHGKRKRLSDGGAAAACGGGGSGSGKMMRFFEGLMKQVMERQDVMQQRFMEAIEKREQDRMIREEAWRRQEMAHLAREQDILAQERAMAASRDAAVVSFIQKITGQTIPMPSIAAPAITVIPPPSQPHPTPITSAAPAPPPSQPPPQPQPSPQPQQKSPMPATPQPQQAPPPQQQQQSSMDIVMTPAVAEPHDAACGSGYEGSGGGGPSSSRWPKAEVHALIQLRSNIDTRYQDTGPKGPLWEEISAGMLRLGYNRSAKRCKEKWENINKYFKKVKESNKKRPEDSKTCPYFHHLDALYRNKAALNSNSGGGGANLPPAGHANAAPQERSEAVTVAAPISQTAPLPLQHVTKNGGTSNNAGNGNGGRKGGGAPEGGGGGSGGMQMQASNGGVAAGRFFGEGGGGTAAKKPEDIMKEMMEQRQLQPQLQQQAAINSYNRIDGGADSDNMDEDEDDDYDDDDDDDDVDGNKMQYEIQFQRQQQQQHNVVRPNAAASAGGGNQPGTAAPGTTAAATTTAGSFLGMVQ